MEDLSRRLREAADLVSDLPPAVQPEAFKIAFSELTPGGRRGRSRPRARATATTEGAAPAPARRRSAEGPKAAVQRLVEDGYFADPRSVEEIRDHLQAGRGLRIASKHVATSVLRLLRENRLTRDRDTDGQYRYRAT